MPDLEQLLRTLKVLTKKDELCSRTTKEVVVYHL